MPAAVGVQPCKIPKVYPSRAGTKALNLKAVRVRVSCRLIWLSSLSGTKMTLACLDYTGQVLHPPKSSNPVVPTQLLRGAACMMMNDCTAELGSCSSPPCKCRILQKFRHLHIQYAWILFPLLKDCWKNNSFFGRSKF